MSLKVKTDIFHSKAFRSAVGVNAESHYFNIDLPNSCTDSMSEKALISPPSFQCKVHEVLYFLHPAVLHHTDTLSLLMDLRDRSSQALNTQTHSHMHAHTARVDLLTPTSTLITYMAVNQMFRTFREDEEKKKKTGSEMYKV